jgi:hypothetical protein
VSCIWRCDRGELEFIAQLICLIILLRAWCYSQLLPSILLWEAMTGSRFSYYGVMPDSIHCRRKRCKPALERNREMRKPRSNWTETAKVAG